MAGLLDIMDDPVTAGALGLLSAAGPSRMPVSVGQALGQGYGAFQQQQRNMQDRGMNDLKTQLMRGQLDEHRYATDARAKQQQALMAIREQLPENVRPMFDIDPAGFLKSLQKEEEAYTLGPGQVRFKGGQQVAAVPAEAKKTQLEQMLDAAGITDPMQRQQFIMQGLQKSVTHAPAASVNVSPKIDVKTGESLGAQVGPMLKDSKLATQGAVKMFDSADRIISALDSGKVMAGPLASKVMTVKQFVNSISGGKDEGIRQTRQVIRALAESSVEARKELAGQGQVTENEAKAVEKAMSGNIDDLTVDELRDIATLNKRAAYFRAMNHQQMLSSMNTEGTRQLVPFYQVPGMDALLNHDPKLPTINDNSLDSLLKKYGSQ